jgi:hypothetical protein
MTFLSKAMPWAIRFIDTAVGAGVVVVSAVGVVVVIGGVIIVVVRVGAIGVVVAGTGGSVAEGVAEVYVVGAG